jgi:hypothetical protein
MDVTWNNLAQYAAVFHRGFRYGRHILNRSLWYGFQELISIKASMSFTYLYNEIVN